MSFNTSTRKEDVSLKLRQNNLRNAQEHTKQLEVESMQMEERLQQLKMAMNREKELNSGAQDGFWRSGQTGTLGSYGKDVLNKPTKPKSQKQRKIKVLKAEPPAAPPERNKGPGTMAYLAQQKNGGGRTGKENKVSGPRCGQCEEKGAQVTCVECGEDYCAPCFAGFHLKGNLRKHRSVPFGSTATRTPRGMVTPRKGPKTSPNAGDELQALNQESTAAEKVKTSPGSIRDGSSVSGGAGGMLMSGDYDEAESAQSFQEALRAWRNPGATGAPSSGTKPSGTNQGARTTTSKLHHQAMSMDSGTSMETSSLQNVDIKFTQSLTYAERLLLKKHRRTELNAMPDDLYSSGSRSAASDHHGDVTLSRSVPLLASNHPEETPVEVLAELRATNEDGIVWRDIHRANRDHNFTTSDENERSESRVSIIELASEEYRQPGGRARSGRLEESSQYNVQEVGIEEDRAALNARRNSAASQRKMAFESPTKQLKSSRDEKPLKPRTKGRSTASKTESNGTDLSIDLSKVKGDERPKSVKSSARVKSARAKSARSRPQSRAMSRAETARTLYGEGELTKTPSDALREIARMTPRQDPTPFLPTMTDFFTAGVVIPEQTKDKVLTPSKFKGKEDPSGIPKWKVSYNLYNMAPRSWHPTSSLQDAIPVDEAQQTIEGATAPLLHQVTSGAALEDTEQTVSFSISEGIRLTDSRSGDSEDLHGSDLAEMQITTPRNSRPTSQASLHLPTARSQSAASDKTLTPRPESRAIVVDGDDMSCYDDQTGPVAADDDEALYNLEYELATQEGRVTSDGKISRLSIQTDAVDSGADSDQDSVPSAASFRILGSDPNRPPSPGASYDARVNELMDDFEEIERQIMEEDEVRALH